MNSNLNEGSVLQYVVSCLQIYGITEVDVQHFKKAKNNDFSVQPTIQSMLFHLCVLHLLDYAYTIDELEIEFHNQEEQRQIILAHLHEIACPLLVDGDSHFDIDFKSNNSRTLLLICGWIMAVGHFFTKITSTLKHRLENIYSSKKQHNNSKHKIFSHSSRVKLDHPDQTVYEKISRGLKVIKHKKYCLECLVEKQGKLKQKLKKELAVVMDEKEDKINLFIEQVILQRGSGEVDQHLEEELKKMIQSEIENLKYRHYFWMWLDDKNINKEITDIKSSVQDNQQIFEIGQATQQIQYEIVIDADYLQKFVHKCKDYEKMIESFEEKMLDIHEPTNLKKHEKEKIRKEILFQNEQIKEKSLNDSRKVSFIGLQIRNYMKLKENVEDEGDEKEKCTRAGKLQLKLRKEIKKYIASIDGIVFV